MISELSRTKAYKSKTQPNQEFQSSPLRDTHDQYISPVIKHTIESLPFIYGGNSNKKRRYNIFPKNKYDLTSVLSRSNTSSVHKNQKLDNLCNEMNQQKNRGHSCLEMKKFKQNLIDREIVTRTVMKHNKRPEKSKSPDALSESKSHALSMHVQKKPVNLELMNDLAKPRQNCSKQYCSCNSLYHQYKEEIQKKLKQKNNKSTGRTGNLSKIQLPRLSVDLQKSPPKLDDQESKHKVGFKYKINSLEQQVSQNNSYCIMCHKEKQKDHENENEKEQRKEHEKEYGKEHGKEQKQADNLELKGILGLIKKKQLQEKKKTLSQRPTTQTIGVQSEFPSLRESQVQNEDFGMQANLNKPTTKLQTIDQQINTDFEDEKKDFKYLQNNRSLQSSNAKQKKQPLQHLSHLKQKYKYKKRQPYESKLQERQDEEESNCHCDHQNQESDNKSSNRNKRTTELRRSNTKKDQQQVQQFDINLQSQSAISQSSIFNHLTNALMNNGDDKSTIFKKLKKRQQQSQNEQNQFSSKKAKKNKEKNPIKLINEETGLFSIPQENEYIDYLKGYQPISKDFKIKSIIKSQNFKILKYNDTLYFGQTDLENRKHGKALYISPKQIFEGVYENGIKMSGCERNIDGVYIGEFLNGQRHGQGKWLWNNGQVYEGEWKLGTKSGHGIWKSPKGDSYEGEWLLNRQQGKGIHRHKSSTYEGQFVQSLKEGSGKQKFINGDQYIGEYLRGKPHGKGKYVWKNGQFYEGEFKNGLRDGFGKWYYSQKAYYEGQFKGDFKHGYGIQVLENGDEYKGEYVEGVRTLGTFTEAKTGKIMEIRIQNKNDKKEKRFPSAKNKIIVQSQAQDKAKEQSKIKESEKVKEQEKGKGKEQDKVKKQDQAKQQEQVIEQHRDKKQVKAKEQDPKDKAQKSATKVSAQKQIPKQEQAIQQSIIEDLLNNSQVKKEDQFVESQKEVEQDKGNDGLKGDQQQQI